jgi:hypothetical protein
VFLKILNAICVCWQYKHPRSIKRAIRSDKPVTLLLLHWSHKCDFGAEPRSCIIATSAVKGLSSISDGEHYEVLDRIKAQFPDGENVKCPVKYLQSK